MTDSGCGRMTFAELRFAVNTLRALRDMPPSDNAREGMIADVSARLLDARERSERVELWNTLRMLINGRSASRVARMERDRGLR